MEETLSPLESYERLGYAIFPGHFNAEEVKFLRNFFLKRFARKESDYPSDIIRHPVHKGDIYFNIYERFPELQPFLFNERLIKAVASILGPMPCYVPTPCAMVGVYGYWHRDTDSEESKGYTFFKEPDYKMLQAAVYLQDNTEESGGGIDVVRGSHDRSRKIVPKLKKLRWLKPTIGERIGYFFKDLGLVPEPDQRVQSKAGDLILFRTTLLHKASTGRGVPLPMENEKVALFDGFMSRSKSTLAWIDHIRDLKLKEYAHLDLPAPAEMRRKAEAVGFEYYSIDSSHPEEIAVS